jgi:hypothetical protein
MNSHRAIAVALTARQRQLDLHALIREQAVTGKPIDATILALLAARPPGKTVSPEEVARAVAGDSDWHTQLGAVRRVAVQLALDGRLVIFRKGRPVDPNDFKGVYRLGLPHLE